MSTYILMKVLESAPNRYDQGIRLLTLGQLDQVYDRLTSHIRAGQTVLDLGCGTGALTLKAAGRGARVKGIDVNAQMLAIAQQRADRANLSPQIELGEMGVAELGNEEAESYDVVMSGLCFSELTNDELVYTLTEVKRVLKPDGLLLVADEVSPNSLSKRLLVWLIKLPLVLVTYLLMQTTTTAVKHLPQRIIEAGFVIESITLNKMESFIELIAKNPGEGLK